VNKIRTLGMLEEHLDAEFAWRLKELADMRLAIRGGASIPTKTLIRAAVPLAYAHWEGFVKSASLLYVNYVDTLGLRYDQLTNCFVALGMRGELNELLATSQVGLQISVMERITSGLSEKSKLKSPRSIDTQSNLNSRVFENIAVSIGLDTGPYKTRYNMIDESLLGRRNRIAHGEYLELSADAARDLLEEVIDLLRTYRNELSNAAAGKAYLRT
jgi:hypothetical protein